MSNTVNIKRVPEAMFQPLYSRARETGRNFANNQIAVEMVSKTDNAFS